jgi:tetratricopeptide (TPR) repeat protein
VLLGYQNRQLVFFELGDMVSVHRELHAADLMAEELRQPVQSWLRVAIRAVLALLEGRFADAESLMSEHFKLGGRSNRSDAVAAHTLHLFQLRREQGRLSELEELVSTSAQEFTWYPMFRCALAILYCELGRETEARAVFEQIAAEDFAAVPVDNEWLFSMALLSEIAHVLGDDRRAKSLYQKLLPYADRNAFAAVEGCTGSVSRCLGLLAATMSRLDGAARHYEEGLEHNARMGARPWVARTQHDFAVLLVNREGQGDRARAIDLLSDALRTCDELGMPALRAKVSAVLAGVGVVVSTVHTAPAAEHGVPLHESSVPVVAEDGTFRLEGEYWSIGYAGRLLRLKDSKGLRILARLLAEPGRPYPAVDLERLGEGGDQPTVRALSAQDAGELLDDEARRAYRARLLELRAAVDEEDAGDDADQAGAMREEIDFITRELSRALGLGGRSRHAGSIAERARLNVTRAVKSAIRRIAASDAGLAAHLEPTVRTGTVCVYSPDPRSPVGWHVSLGDVHQG